MATAWNQKPTECVIFPIKLQGEIKAIVIAGLNPCDYFDENYQSFFHLMTSQISSILSNVLSREAERKRAEKLAEIDRTKTEFFSKWKYSG